MVGGKIEEGKMEGYKDEGVLWGEDESARTTAWRRDEGSHLGCSGCSQWGALEVVLL